MRVADLLAAKPSRRIVTLLSTATAMEASSLMEREGVGSVMVVGVDGRFMGVVAERHLAIAIAGSGARLFRTPLAALMRPGGPVASPGDTVADAIRMVSGLRVRHLPVVEDRELVGVVSTGDLLEAHLIEKAREPSALLAQSRQAAA